MTASRELSDSDYQTLARFRYALRTFLRFSEDAARRADLTPSQHQLLLMVRGFPGPHEPSMADVAEFLQLRLHSAGFGPYQVDHVTPGVESVLTANPNWRGDPAVHFKRVLLKAVPESSS